MDEIDFMLSNRQPINEMERRVLAQNRREYNETRRAELEAAAEARRRELRFNAMRMVGVEPGAHFNASQAIVEAEVVRDEQQRHLDQAERQLLEKRRQLAEINALMSEADKMVARMFEAEQLVVPISPDVEPARRSRRRPFVASRSGPATPEELAKIAELRRMASPSAYPEICRAMTVDGEVMAAR